MNIFRTWSRWLCLAWMPLYFGGDSESDNSTSTTTSTVNNVRNEERQAVASDSAVSVTGDHNLTQRNETTNITDASDRSIRYADNSDRRVTTNTNTNTNTSTTVTDFGSIAKALDGMAMVSRSAIELADNSLSSSVALLKKQAGDNLAVAKDFMAGQITAANEAKNGNEKALGLGALAVAGAVAVAFIIKK